MNATLRAVLKVFLVLAVLTIVVLAIFGLVIYMDWPWWIGIFILCGLLGLTLLFLFIRRLFKRRKEQQFVEQIIQQDEARIQSMASKDKEYARELQLRWKEALDALRMSHLKKLGNPLYVLPWYLVMGESGSGKTTAIQSARLSSPFTEVSSVSGVSGTKNCDWWFFEQAVIIDTAGRYAIPIDEGRDKDEWQRFLNLLTKYRKQEPINGLIVGVSADKLLQSPPDVLQDDGRNIRRRINELMLVLGAKFPVYILVTKCDLVQGMSHFCDKLPEKALDQAMGFVNTKLSTDVAAFERDVMGAMGERLRDLRLLILHQSESRSVEPGLLLFPEEFDRLEKGLNAFAQGAFLENPYQETPILRGIYFSSGRQEGSPYSHFLNALGLIGEKEVLPGTNKGLFLHDFFARILPKERGLFAPTVRYVEWKRLTTNLGLTAWVAILLALCGLLSFSFFKNLTTLKEFSHVFASPPTLSGTDTVADLGTMEQFREAILKMEKRNRDWWLPRLYLNQSKEAEIELKKSYCNLFKKGFLVGFDDNMKHDIEGLSSSTPPASIERIIFHLVRRIDLITGRINDESVGKLRQKPAPNYWLVKPPSQEGESPDLTERFGGLYVYYLAWRMDSSMLPPERDALIAQLMSILDTQGMGLHWLVAWANSQGTISPITLSDFWMGSQAIPEEKIIIAPAFTAKGHELIFNFIGQIESALPNNVKLGDRKKEFKTWYDDLYTKAWQDFAVIFPKGSAKLNGRTEWQQEASTITTDQGPYLSFLERATTELQPMVTDGSVPFWAKLIYQLKLSRASAGAAEALKTQGQGVTGKLAAKKDQLAQKVTQKLGGLPVGLIPGAESMTQVGPAYEEYLNALKDIGQAAGSRKKAYLLASQVFKQDQAVERASFDTAYGDVEKLRQAMWSQESGGEVLWALLRGPVNFMWVYSVKETACYLQDQWETEVLRQIQEDPNPKNTEAGLLAEEGYVKKYLSGTAGPFVSWNLQEGYFAKTALEASIPFEPAMFKFVGDAANAARQYTKAKEQERAQEKARAQEEEKAKQAEKDSYTVTVKALPTGANPEAQLIPHETRLELDCSTGVQSLVNFSYPVQKVFRWSPKACSDVVLQIHVGTLVLTKIYSGDDAFPDFLRDFSAGYRNLYPRQFRAEEQGLKDLGITYIRVAYSFVGDRAVLGRKSASASPPPTAPPPTIPSISVPKEIAPCWGQ